MVKSTRIIVMPDDDAIANAWEGTQISAQFYNFRNFKIWFPAKLTKLASILERRKLKKKLHRFCIHFLRGEVRLESFCFKIL